MVTDNPVAVAPELAIWRLILWPVTALYCAVVASIVFAPVHVDDNEMGGRLVQFLDTGHAEGWLPRSSPIRASSSSNVIMFIPAVFSFALLPKPKARPMCCTRVSGQRLH